MVKERELYRHHFYEPVQLDLRGLWLDDEIMSGFNLHMFKLMNISGSGMNFISDLSLPANKKVSILFSLTLDSEHLLKGVVVRREQRNDTTYAYAVKFNITSGDQLRLIKSINLLQIKKKQFNKPNKN